MVFGMRVTLTVFVKVADRGKLHHKDQKQRKSACREHEA